MPYRVRPASPEDADSIGRVHVESWQACYRGQMPDEVLDSLSIPARAEQWRRRLSSEAVDGAVFVAEDGEDVVGFASCGAARGDYALDESGELEAIYLHPRAWGSGLGSRLLDEVERNLIAAGYPRAMLWVLTANERARRFYEARAWTFDGTEKMYHRDGHDIPEVRYVKPL